ncbi:Protein of unknown function [Flagellimonas pacifica]|uniref:Inner membrane protein YgaP-like transmembrane domain-containing protein n=2 Tax=Flagellimonas pacifica TaxID=1247520 RepID=A0A285MDX1_9FLAO|nr:Protein of unknown function [Allomuricauda parva]
MGGLDRMVRTIIAVIVFALYYLDVIEETLAYILLGLSGIFVLTSFISFCPLYTLFGMNTCKVKK